jgi:hypothetical protein
MYKLSLNNEELFELRTLLEREKAKYHPNWHDPSLEAVLTKLVIAQIEAQDEAIVEAKAERYAMNLHSRPEGA